MKRGLEGEMGWPRWGLYSPAFFVQAVERRCLASPDNAFVSFDIARFSLSITARTARQRQVPRSSQELNGKKPGHSTFCLSLSEDQ